MNGSINGIANLVLDGRRKMARITVLTTVSAIPAIVFRKVLLQGQNDDDSDAWGGIGVMSDEDEHAFDYEQKGFAMVLLDQFTGAALNKGLIAVDYAEPSFMVQIEPFNPDIDLFKQYVDQTGWHPESGDAMCLLIRDDFALWVENVGQQGQTLVSDFAVKYLLNKRDDLSYLSTFDQRPEL